MKICIVCEKEIKGNAGSPVKEDRIIRTLRKIKEMFKIAKKNELYVCKEDLKKHQERRKSFEKGVLFTSIGAGLVIVVTIARTILSGFQAWAILSGVVLAFFILLLPLFKYTPAIEGGDTKTLPITKKKVQIKKGK